MTRSGSRWPPNIRDAFVLAGSLSERDLAAFPELRLSDVNTGNTTVLYGQIDSATELRAMLGRFDARGLSIIEMWRLPD
ncbi:hypothetical protein [Rhodococcus jostii]|uniref:Uncharacterized protein n=1 Tax=Rhodococcus jostii TaxID=132919 RepID=A0A1H4IPR2_RHOJO|nr:hypothetical protein [Rhodococcus jostii]SEB36091.1 hypothetical protein SAMN04490220_0360 [Rhodococcus jostii]